MDQKTKDEWDARALKRDADFRAMIARREEFERQRRALRTKLLPGTDIFTWVAPDDTPPSDELLAEHCAQLRTMVRYTLQYVLDDSLDSLANMRAADAATRMIRTNIALAKALDAKNVKTVRGGKRMRRTQD